MYLTIFVKILMATELQVFVLVRVTVNAPLVRAYSLAPGHVTVWVWYTCHCERNNAATSAKVHYCSTSNYRLPSYPRNDK